MKWIRRFIDGVRRRGGLILVFVGFWLVSACGGHSMHDGRWPFRLMEKSPKVRAEMSALAHHQTISKEELQAGDVVAFWMSHDEAISFLKRGVIQKIPYELFRYGHVALVVPDPKNGEKLRLLQIAMRQAVNVDHGLEYLDGKDWQVFRPEPGSVDAGRLSEFTELALERGNDARRAYDYSGVFGIKNAPWQPESPEEVGSKYSCATLVVAGLHYAGYELDAVHRGGHLDVVTPRQVVNSGGVVRREN